MTCPICGGETKITNSRPKCDHARRRRECLECGHRFSTIELEEDVKDRLELKGGTKI